VIRLVIVEYSINISASFHLQMSALRNHNTCFLLPCEGSHTGDRVHKFQFPFLFIDFVSLSSADDPNHTILSVSVARFHRDLIYSKLNFILSLGCYCPRASVNI